MNEIRCEIRLAEETDKPARLTGTLMVFGERARDRAEVFEVGSLKWDEAGIVLNRQHQRAAPILRLHPVEVEGRLVVDAEIPDTTAGRDALAEIRSGLFRGLSIEFRAVKQSIVAGVRRISEAVLTGAALCDSPAYESATVEARAKAQKDIEWERWRETVL